MEKTSVKTTLDFRTLKYCNLFIMKYKRKAHLWFIISAVISIGVVVYDLVRPETNYMFAILGGVFVLYTIYQFFTMEKKLDSQLMKFFHNKRVTDQVVDIDEEKITVTRSFDKANPLEYDWSFITEILEMPQYYMLMAGKGSPVIIDRSFDALLDGTKENLDAIVKEKAKGKPYKAVDKDIVKIPITYVHQEFPEVVSEEIFEANEKENTEEAQIEELEVEDIQIEDIQIEDPNFDDEDKK